MSFPGRARDKRRFMTAGCPHLRLPLVSAPMATVDRVPWVNIRLPCQCGLPQTSSQPGILTVTVTAVDGMAKRMTAIVQMGVNTLPWTP